MDYSFLPKHIEWFQRNYLPLKQALTYFNDVEKEIDYHSRILGKLVKNKGLTKLKEI